MPFIPHTDSDVAEMLAVIDVANIAELFDEIPKELLIDSLDGVPDGLSEMDVTRLMHERAARDGGALGFIGAGAYEHHIPAAVWQIATRGEFYSAYTPYQAEASQGTLQVIYEFQSMMAGLTGTDISNASMYDGASALAEAALMAVRANRRSASRRVVASAGTNRTYLRVSEAITGSQGLTIERMTLDSATGTSLPDLLDDETEAPVAVVIQQPAFFGTLEDVDTITDRAHALGALVIAVVNPISLAVLKPPGEWGETGADIVCGEGQPLGVPLSSGGPYFGFMTCKKAIVRQMPGRIVGRTIDLDGKSGFTLTLQAREQHIRRSKATSNICTNQGLAVTAATIYMALLGADGLKDVATCSHQRLGELLERLIALPGVSQKFPGPHFHEAVLELNRPVGPVLEALLKRGIVGGYDLSRQHPELGNAMLVCTTETKNGADLDAYATTLDRVLAGNANA